MSTGAKSFSAPVGEQRSFILFPAPPVPSAQLPPISAGHQPAQRQQALIATVLNYWKEPVMQNSHPQTACYDDPPTIPFKAKRMAKCHHFMAISRGGEKNWRQEIHEKPTPYTGQHKSLPLVSKKKIGMECARKQGMKIDQSEASSEGILITLIFTHQSTD